METITLTPRSIGSLPNTAKFFRIERRGVIFSKALAASLPPHIGVRFDYKGGAVTVSSDKEGFVLGHWAGMYLIPSRLLAEKMMEAFKLEADIRHYVEPLSERSFVVSHSAARVYRKKRGGDVLAKVNQG